MKIDNNIIVDSFDITGRGKALVTNLEYDKEYFKFNKGDLIYYEDKNYEVLSVEAILKNDGKEFVSFFVNENMEKNIKKSAQVVLLNEEGLVLGVSRKDNHNDFGLPGGKQEPEDINEIAAAIREVKEETGLDIYDLQLVFAMHKQGYMGYTYLAKYSGEINHNEPHVVKWVPFEVIMKGSFGKFNTLVSESLDDMGILYQKKIDLKPMIEELAAFIAFTIRKGYVKPFELNSVSTDGTVFLKGNHEEEFDDWDEEYENAMREIGKKYYVNLRFPSWYWMK